MKNLLNRLDELEDGSYGRRLRKTEREIMYQRSYGYRHNPYRRIRPIKARCLVGKHVNDVIKKYVSYLPPNWRSDLRLLNYLGIEIKAKDGQYIDADGDRSPWRGSIYRSRYYVNENGIISKKERECRRWRQKNSYTRPEWRKIHAEKASKERKKDREDRKKAAIELGNYLSQVFNDDKRLILLASIEKEKQRAERERLDLWWKNWLKERKKK